MSTPTPTLPSASRTTLIASNVAFPLAVGTTVTWSATATGGVGPLHYKFWAQDQAVGTWTVMRDYAPTPSALWVAPKQGTYMFQVWVRSAGQTALYGTFDTRSNQTVTTPAPSIPFFTADRPLPVPPGTAVTWTTQAGGTGPLEYEYWLFRPSTNWWKQQPYSLSPTFVWTPTIADTYRVSVRVRPAGSQAGYLANKDVLNQVVATGAISSVGLTAS